MTNYTHNIMHNRSFFRGYVYCGNDRIGEVAGAPTWETAMERYEAIVENHKAKLVR